MTGRSISKQTTKAVARWRRPAFVALCACVLVPAATMAAPKGVFDDWKPGGPRIQLPKPKPAPSLAVADVLGTWCSVSSSYIIERTRLTVVTRDGNRATYRISRLDPEGQSIRMVWILNGQPRNTVFNQFSADKRRMVQLAGNRTYERCAQPRVVKAKLAHKDIIGMWCATNSTYIISRTALTTLFQGGGRRVLPVRTFTFTERTVQIAWTNNGNLRKTTFGSFSADRKRMTQFGVNRAYRRCTTPSVGGGTVAGALGYRAVLGQWCVGSVRYTIQRERMIVVSRGSQPVVYAITGFRFFSDSVSIRWLTLQGRPRTTRYGRFSSDRRTMRALATGATWRRC